MITMIMTTYNIIKHYSISVVRYLLLNYIDKYNLIISI